MTCQHLYCCYYLKLYIPKHLFEWSFLLFRGFDCCGVINKKNKLFVVFFFKKVPCMYCTVTTRCWDNVKQWHVFLSYSWIIYNTNIYIVCSMMFFFFVKDTSDRKIMFNNKYLFPNNILFVVVNFGPRWNGNFISSVLCLLFIRSPE